MTAPVRQQTQEPTRDMQAVQTFSAVGDIYLAKILRSESDAGFLEAVRLFRSANARFGNVETLLHDYDSPPAAQVPGSLRRSSNGSASRWRRSHTIIRETTAPAACRARAMPSTP
jgi:hypothetical protein